MKKGLSARADCSTFARSSNIKIRLVDGNSFPYSPSSFTDEE